jgi:hypothetical protein
MEPQSFANHTRWQRPFHFFVAPVMAINLLWCVVAFLRAPGLESAWLIIVSAAFLVLTFLVRINSLKVQDRVIRLEENLRYQRLLSPATLQKAGSLTEAQIVALRFAGDDELEELVCATLAGKFAKGKDIKRAIRDWRADNFRV